MKKLVFLKLINCERIGKSLLFNSCGTDNWCGCESTNDLCPCEGDCHSEFCLCKADG